MLIILAAVAIVALGVMYLVMPAYEAFNLTAGEMEMQRARLEALRQDNARLPEYLAGEAEANEKLAVLTTKIPTFHAQEITLQTLNDVAADNALTLISVAFSGVKIDTREALVAQLKGAQASENASGGGVYLRHETITVNFSGEYGAIFGFIGDLAKEQRTVFTRGMALSRANGGTITGSVTLLVMSAAPQEGEEYPGYTYDAAKATNKADPFTAFPAYFENLPTEEAPLTEEQFDQDFYAIINTYDDNAAKVLMSRLADGAPALSASDNKVINASLTLEEKDGKLTYTYELAGKKQTGTLETTKNEGFVVFRVLSCARKNSKDKVGLKLDVTNDSSYTLRLDVRNDDSSAPRFTLGKTQGKVTQIGK